MRIRGNAPQRSGPYPLGEFPHVIAVEIGKHIVHRLAVGQTDITGDDFGEMFASAISGIHRRSPLGIADVERNGCAWSVKTVKGVRPFTQTKIRAISGRNSPDFSHGIQNVHSDLAATGRAVLEIWNGRVDEAFRAHDDLRILVLVRNLSTLHFTIFEHEAARFVPTEYTWEKNAGGNFVGSDSLGNHCFTWQPHGAQFTIIRSIPKSAYRFKIAKKPITISEQQVLGLVNFDDSWIVEVKVP